MSADFLARHGVADRLRQYDLGNMPAGTLDERILSRKITVDAPLATAWTPYTFYRAGQFSHCGTNAFQLVLTADGKVLLDDEIAVIFGSISAPEGGLVCPACAAGLDLPDAERRGVR